MSTHLHRMFARLGCLFVVVWLTVSTSNLGRQTVSPADARVPDPWNLSSTGAQAQAQEQPLAAGPGPGGEGFADTVRVALGGMRLIGSLRTPEGLGENTDLAFEEERAFVGNFGGFFAVDIRDPSNPLLLVAVSCPGAQGDVSVYASLVIVSVESPGSRRDCGSRTSADGRNGNFAGIRIFDTSEISSPRQIALVSTCRGSHTHTIVTSPLDTENLYIYVSGQLSPILSQLLHGCSPEESLFQIEVIRVPLAQPAEAVVVGAPKILSAEETPLRGLDRAGLPGPLLSTGCHDIAAYPAIGLAAGACEGNGILLDIRDPEEPHRIVAVADPNFAYWHSATFNNDGTKVIFTDEWGGGRSPRCRDTDPPIWGADAVFDLDNDTLRFRSYYKLQTPQSRLENCVAHNGSLIPVPGRDILVQAWYQGGISVVDFTDASVPVEIAYFDRGVVDAGWGGYWSAYCYNGHIFGSEIRRGLDVFELVPTAHLSENEIEAAKLVRHLRLNAQHQVPFTWPIDIAVARAYLDQVRRRTDHPDELIAQATALLDAAELADSGMTAEIANQMSDLSSRLRTFVRSSGAGLEHRSTLLAADQLAAMSSELLRNTVGN